MAPSAEKMTEHQQRALPTIKAGPPEKNIAVAVNYELALVDQFLADTRKRRRKDSETDTSNPTKEIKRVNSGSMEDAEELEKKEPAAETPYANGTNRRMSMRERSKRGANLSRTRIRYDFQLVPTVRRNSDFLKGYKMWWINNGQRRDQDDDSNVSVLKVGRENSSDAENNEPEYQKVVDTPFRDNSTVLWMPQKRSHWEDCVSEMTAVCTQAAIRRHPPEVPFVQPLSREYIRDRIDIDDPQLGYQLRHRKGGWLQGFILFTNFTTWNLGFRWDSRHPASGIPASNGLLVDRDGSLSAELESQPHSGDTNAGGVVFPTVAEISLLGGLGCGEYLLRMALDDIRARGHYNFVVLQATTMSRPFYEKFGFVRVGAVCCFRQQIDDAVPLVGYRHWTHANESQKSLDMHGGPSYMMCLKLSETPDRPFFERLLELRVENKPLVENLGGGATTMPKSTQKLPSIDASTSFESMVSPDIAIKKKKPGPKSWSRKIEPKPPIVESKKRDSDKRGKKRRSSDIINEDLTPKRTKSGRPRGRPPRPIPKDQLTASLSCKSKSTKKKKMSPINLGTTSISTDKNRVYHSVRGPDGRFVRVLMDENFQIPPDQQIAKKKRGRPPGKKNMQKIVADAPKHPTERSSFISTTRPGIPVAIDAKKLKKQKVLSYPRDRPHYYNKVVRHKHGRKKIKYYFVLEYDETKKLMCLVPMAATGTLSGQRSGRPRYTCSILSDDSNFEILPPDGFEPIPATMIMKTPYVASEAWDIEDNA